MGCVYHPNYEATTLCDQCQADLCDGCAFSMENGHTLCHRCMLSFSLQDVKSEAYRRKQAEEAQQLGLKKRYRPGYLHVLLAVGAVLATASRPGSVTGVP